MVQSAQIAQSTTDRYRISHLPERSTIIHRLVPNLRLTLRAVVPSIFATMVTVGVMAGDAAAKRGPRNRYTWWRPLHQEPLPMSSRASSPMGLLPYKGGYIEMGK